MILAPVGVGQSCEWRACGFRARRSTVVSRALLEPGIYVLRAAVPPFSKEFCELDGVFANGRWVSVHLADAVKELRFGVQSAMTITETNPLSFYQTDPEKVAVKLLGVVMFFPKVRAYIARKLLNNPEHSQYNAV